MGGFDASGLPLDVDCAAKHPDSGHGCIEPAGHDGLHRAMGRVRIQAFGPSAQANDACGGDDPWTDA